jgi:hypothetical protein
LWEDEARADVSEGERPREAEQHATAHPIRPYPVAIVLRQGKVRWGEPSHRPAAVTHLRVKQIERSEVRTDFVERDHEVTAVQ